MRHRNGLFLLLAATVLLVTHHIFAYFGHYGFDDMHYAELAARWATQGFAVTDDHYTYRWGLLWPLSVVYGGLGISDHTSALVAILAVLSTVWVILKVTESLTLWARWIAVFGFLTCEWVLFYTDKIMPDVIVMAGATWAFYAVYQAYFGEQKSPIRWAVLGNIGWWFAFLAKETIIFVLPAFVLIALVFYRNWSSVRRFWVWAALVFALFLMIYAAVIYGLTGDITSRFKAIALNSYFNTCSYDQLPVEHLYRRIGYEFWRMLLGTGVAVALPFLWPGTDKPESKFWWALGVGLLLLGNFMTTSYRNYVPLCLDIRHYLFVVPILAIMSGWVLSQYRQWSRLQWIWAIGSAFLLAVVAFKFERAVYLLYTLLAVSLILLAINMRFAHIGVKMITWIGVIGFMAYTPYKLYRNAQSSNYVEKRDLVHQVIRPTTTPLTIVTNPAERNMCRYLMGFDTSRVEWLTFSMVQPEQLATIDSVLLLMNGFTEYQSNLNWDKLPEWVRQPAKPRVVVAYGRGVELQRFE
jgi:hypothetical protein